MEDNNFFNDETIENPIENQSDTSETSNNEKPPKKRKGISWVVLVACMLATLLIGCVLGGVIDGLTENLFNGYFKSSGKTASGNESTPVPTATSDAYSTPDSNASNGLVFGTNDPGNEQNVNSTPTQKDIVTKCRESIVSINIEVVSSSYYYGETVSTGSGSGVIITADGYIATCNHVINGATKITVTLQDGTSYDAVVIGYDSRTDLAVIKIDVNNLPAATLSAADDYAVGDSVYAVGNPLGEFASTVTQGIVSGINRSVEIDGTTMTLLQTDAAVNPGNSGGGLFSQETGKLIGIVNAKSYGIDVEGLGFAIPTEIATPIITDLMDNGFVSGRPYLGISMKDATINSGSSFNPFGGMFGSYTNVVLVVSVADDSPAKTAGILSGDYIVKLGDKDISTTDEFKSALNYYNSGDTVTVTIQRGNETMEFTITLGEARGKN